VRSIVFGFCIFVVISCESAEVTVTVAVIVVCGVVDLGNSLISAVVTEFITGIKNTIAFGASVTASAAPGVRSGSCCAALTFGSAVVYVLVRKNASFISAVLGVTGRVAAVGVIVGNNSCLTASVTLGITLVIPFVICYSYVVAVVTFCIAYVIVVMLRNSGSAAAVTFCIAVVLVIVRSFTGFAAYSANRDTVVLVGVRYLSLVMAGVTFGVAVVIVIVRSNSGLSATVTVAVTLILVYVAYVLVDVVTTLNVTGVVAFAGVLVLGFSRRTALVTVTVAGVVVNVVDFSYCAAAIAYGIAAVLPVVTGICSVESALVTLNIALVIPLVRNLICRESGSAALVTVGIASVIVSVRRNSRCFANLALRITGRFPVRSYSYVGTSGLITVGIASIRIFVLNSSSEATVVTSIVTVVIVLVLGNSCVSAILVTFGVAVVSPGVRRVVVGI